MHPASHSDSTLCREANSHWAAPVVENAALFSLCSLCSCFPLLEFLPAQDHALVAVLHQLAGQLPALQETRKGEESGSERREGLQYGLDIVGILPILGFWHSFSQCFEFICLAGVCGF